MNITFELVNEKPVRPQPLERCYRPKNLKDMNKAKELMENRNA
jgi:hypothetical protein